MTGCDSPNSSAFDEFGFVNELAQREGARLHYSWGTLQRLREGPQQALASPRWMVERADMLNPAWIYARMALDVRRMAVKAGEIEVGAVNYDDLVDMGWRRDQVRAHGGAALASAMVSLLGAGRTCEPRRDKTALPVLGSIAMGLCGAIGLTLTAIATLI